MRKAEQTPEQKRESRRCALQDYNAAIEAARIEYETALSTARADYDEQIRLIDDDPEESEER